MQVFFENYQWPLVVFKDFIWVRSTVVWPHSTPKFVRPPNREITVICIGPIDFRRDSSLGHDSRLEFRTWLEFRSYCLQTWLEFRSWSLSVSGRTSRMENARWNRSKEAFIWCTEGVTPNEYFFHLQQNFHNGEHFIIPDPDIRYLLFLCLPACSICHLIS